MVDDSLIRISDVLVEHRARRWIGDRVLWARARLPECAEGNALLDDKEDKPRSGTKELAGIRKLGQRRVKHALVVLSELFERALNLFNLVSVDHVDLSITDAIAVDDDVLRQIVTVVPRILTQRLWKYNIQQFTNPSFLTLKMQELL